LLFEAKGLRYLFMDQRLTWENRLHSRRDFTAVYSLGRRFQQGALSMWVYRRPDSSRPRLGMAIPTAFGNAVKRNRMKRLLREAFRLHKNTLPPDVDLVFGARRVPVVPLRYSNVWPLVKNLWEKAQLVSRED
jgi:ribonuclease P protein component